MDKLYEECLFSYHRIEDERTIMTGSPDNRIRVLVVSLPGMMQNVLRDTFIKRSDVDLVGVAGGCLSAARMVQQLIPDLVVIDSNLPEIETNQFILWLKQESSSTRTLVLVETTQQSNKATDTGADIVLRSYSLGDHLDRVLEDLRSNSHDH